MSSDSQWAADSPLLIGFTNEVSDANKHLWNPTPVTRSTASLRGNLSSSCKRVYSHRSDHVPPWAIPLITYLATADPPSLLWSHWSISPGKERGRQNTKPLLRGEEGGQHLLLWRTVWAGWAVSAHWMISSSSSGPVNAWTLVSDWASRWGSQCEMVPFPACLTNCCSCLNQLFLHNICNQTTSKPKK